jgi:two-component system NtrC family sensor kinase
VLEEINRLWTVARVFSNTAHDINNSLQVIGGSAELLETGDLDPVLRRRVEAIRAESAKAACTINRLLAYVRAATDWPRTVDVWLLVDAAVAMRAASLGRRRITLTVERQAAPVYITAQESKTLQAILDLLLTAEDRVAGRPHSRIVVRVIAEAAVVSVQLVCAASGEGASGTVNADTAGLDGLTHATQLWAASSIAMKQGGHVAVQGETLTLKLPVAETPTPRS